MLEQRLATFLKKSALILRLLVVIGDICRRLLIVNRVKEFGTLTLPVRIVHGGLVLLTRVGLLVCR